LRSSADVYNSRPPVRLRIARQARSVVVPTGAAHVWGNPFDDPATITVAIRPALKTETFFETLFGLAKDGKINAKTQCLAFCR